MLHLFMRSKNFKDTRNKLHLNLTFSSLALGDSLQIMMPSNFTLDSVHIDILYFFYNFIKPTAETMTYCYASGILENRPNIRAMQLIDEFFLFLVRIKLGLFEQDLAHRFNLHISSVSRKITTWANYLYFLGGFTTYLAFQG